MRSQMALLMRHPDPAGALSDIVDEYARSMSELRKQTEPQRQAGLQARVVPAARKLNGAAAVLAFSVLADSAVEHYRGGFRNRAMYAPLAVSSLTLVASLIGIADLKPRRHFIRDAIYALGGGVGLAGLGFHTFNVFKRPGGLSWLNLFYAAPIGAPVALVLAGCLGRAAEGVRETRRDRLPLLLKRPAGKLLTAGCCLGLGGTIAEVSLLHFRGAFQNPAMYLPVTIPPATAATLAGCLVTSRKWLIALARQMLRLTSVLGIAGAGFHAYGVSRNMGGWRNWSQNLLNGPPIPAPPSFTGLAIAGLAALTLLEMERDLD